MKRILTLLILISVILPVFAANWKQLNNKTYLDTSSLYQEAENPYIQNAWFKTLTNGEKDLYKGKKELYNLSNIRFNCNSRQLSTKELSRYGLNGEIIYSYINYEDLWTSVTPDSQGEYLYNYVCGQYNRTKNISDGALMILQSISDTLDKYNPPPSSRQRIDLNIHNSGF